MHWIARITISPRILTAMACALALSGCGSSAGVSTSPTSTALGATPDQVMFAAPTYTVSQVAGSASLQVARNGSMANAASVNFATADGTAVAGVDYTASAGTVTWAANDSTPQKIVVPVASAKPFAGAKSFQVVLSNPSTATQIATPSAAAVTVTGAGATTAAGSLEFSASGYTDSQSSGTATVTVFRTAGSTGAVSVAYATANGSAVAGTDYTTASGTLDWAAGDTTAKTFQVPILNTAPFSGNKSFTVTLSSPAGGAALGSPSSASVSIAGDAAGAVGSLQLATASYTVVQSAGTLSVFVDRGGGSSGAVSVAYATANGTAAAGTDYTAASGTLNWANGDATPKTIDVAISNTAAYTGSKLFDVTLSSPGGGATLGSPSSASVSIAGSGGTGSGGPSMVSNLQLINQGGSGDAVRGSSASLTNYQKIGWSAATPGADPIASYNIYRNGVLYANTTALTYADTAATNSNSPTWVKNAAIYSYNVAAVDTKGNVGPQAAQMSVYSYQNGVSNWSNADLSYGGAASNENYSSILGNPQGGPYDISVIFASGGLQPAADAPQAPTWDLEIGAFKYFVIDVNPGLLISKYVEIGLVSRLPPGDVFPWADGLNIFDYGPAPVANKWATYKIPLTAFNMGIGSFTGSISGTTLTVTAVSSGGVDAGGFVTGPGVPAGTYITGFNQRKSIGTFTVAGPGISASTSVPSTQMTYQRTSLYKFFIQPQTNPVTMYFNNMGFTAN